MFKHDVVYQDFNGTPHNETLYFHMMVPEWADLQFSPLAGGDFSKYIQVAMASGEGAKIYAIFKLLVTKSYGRRTEDGSGFFKKDEWTEQFLQSPAWEQMFLWLTDPDKNGRPVNAETFYTGIVPPSWAEAAGNETSASNATTSDTVDITKLSREELLAMVANK